MAEAEVRPYRMPRKDLAMADRYPYDSHRSERDRYERDERDDRGLVARAGDEVRSRFGDEHAARRRWQDEARARRASDDWRDDRDYEPRHEGHDFDQDWRERSSAGEDNRIADGLSNGDRDVTLAGSVESRAEKRTAGDVAGVREVQTRLTPRTNIDTEKPLAAAADSGRSRTRN